MSSSTKALRDPLPANIITIKRAAHMFAAGAILLYINQKINCSIQFLYSLGLMDVTKAGTYPLRNNTFTLLLGFSINKNSYVNP